MADAMLPISSSSPDASLAAALLDAWDRQVRIIEALATRVTEETRHALPSPDGWPLDRQLAHIHNVRNGWLSQASPAHAETIPFLYPVEGGSFALDEEGTRPASLEEIKRLLGVSAGAVREIVAEALASGTTSLGPYEHPVLFLGHMVWHEGWHAGLITTGLRLAGHEPTDEWEEANIWGHWRVEEPYDA